MLTYGHTWAYTWTETIRIAADLPGGLNKTNLVLAARNLRLYHPMILGELTLEMNGLDDAFLVEGSDFSQFDAANQSWNVVGDIVDVNGASDNCAYNIDTASCE